MREVMAVVKALADETRMRILMALRPGDICVCQIVELLGLAPSTVSKHMTILKHARLVESRKQGRWMFYRLADKNVPVAAGRMTVLMAELLNGDPRLRQDARQLKQILKMDRDELCGKQNRP